MTDEIILTAAQAVMEKRGVSAIFSPLSGVPVSCKVRLDFDAELRPENLDIGVVEVGTTIQALYADVGEPAHGSTFLVGGTTYRVARIDSNDRIFITVVVNEVT